MFQSKFMESKGKPINYNGKTIRLTDDFQLPRNKCNLKIKIVSTNSEWKQGIAINTNGTIYINNQIFKKKGIRIWEHTAPKIVDLRVETKDCKLQIDNIWDWGNGVTQKWHNGAAMYFEEIPNGKRYYCNDGHPNDDFTDLIFEIIVVDELDEKDQNRKAVPGKKENV